MAHAFEAATAARSTGPVATADMLLAGLTARADPSGSPRDRAAADHGRARHRENTHADSPDRVAARRAAGGAVGDPGRDLQRPSGRRAAAALERDARGRASRRGARGDVSFGVRAAAARARRAVRPHPGVDGLRPDRGAKDDRVAALRASARPGRSVGRRDGAPGRRRDRAGGVAGQEPAARPRRIPAVGGGTPQAR